MAALSVTRKPLTEESTWRRVGDVSNSSSFRGGVARGRGRGGSGARTGRGGRGGGPGGPASAPRSVAESPKTEFFPPKPPSPTAPKLANGKQDPAPDRPKPSRRGSRNVPALVLDPATPTESGPTSAQPGRTRKRPSRNGSKPSPPAQTPSPTVSTRSSVLGSARGGGGRCVPEATQAPSKAKDLPPHLAGATTTTIPHDVNLEVRNNVETLVERMRAVAMQRPASPGHSSHIDWAGDDDDTLPDLDDWGYTAPALESSLSADTVRSDGLGPPKLGDEVISPILEGSLKTLPLLDSITPLIDTPRAAAPSAVVTNDVSAPETKAPEADGRPISPEKPKSRRGARSKNGPKASSKADATSATQKPAPTSPGAAPKAASPPVLPKTEAKATPADFGAGPVEPAKEKPVPVEEKVGVAASIHAPKPAETTTTAPASTGIAASIHAPKPGDALPSAPSGLAASIHAPVGLSASIHAPKPSDSAPTLPPAPNTMDTHPAPSSLRDGTPLQPTHMRSQSRPIRSSRLAPQGDGHARTQSTPVATSARGQQHSRAPHAARPVLTVDALSTIARQLGGRGLGPRAARAEVSTTDK